jgi:hypothetical protein
MLSEPQRQPVSPDHFTSAMLANLPITAKLTGILAAYYRHMVYTAWDSPKQAIYPPLAWLECLVYARGTRSRTLRRMEALGLITRAHLRSTVYICKLAAYKSGRYYPYTTYDYFAHLFERWPCKRQSYLAAHVYRRIWELNIAFAQQLAFDQPCDMPLHEYLLSRAGRADLILPRQKQVATITHICPTNFVPPPSL